ncbi:Uracil-DNA glycosylase [Alteripontixanthobacter maritimus]|uniref:Uracil-DNA glycosylase n=1 Tax=Alteripontixanthobacter maritimus TaxID=2161824 RepID=A0A369Q9A8_9SPHN|nr:uracil-DNA glycosylase [Alteripontixanthobacter maritimus]RDC61294.1 Uracil-DNA glycosylase [Alteripontixanthobacter maritimus]
MLDTVPECWRDALAPSFESPHAAALEQRLQADSDRGKTIYPPPHQRFRALELTPPDAVKAVILGQDPYHGEGQAHGLAFSVPAGVKLPPSLRNIYRELADDISVVRSDGNLDGWAREGVLLLNTALTVEAGRAGSHAKAGWSAITDAIVASVAKRADPAVFILWGSQAQAKAQHIDGLRSEPGDGTPHLVLTAPHPSPLSAYRGFFGSQPFSRTNVFLEASGRGAIDWAAA